MIIVTNFRKKVDNLFFNAIIAMVIIMTVKNRVLRILEENRGEFVSGNEISKQLFVSRNAVWKAVNELKKEGYSIESVTNRGYMLPCSNDIVSPEGIEKYLNYPLKITVLQEVDSTNNYLKSLAAQGADEGTLIVAKKQTGGRGRMGKSFFSPDGTGIYFSLLVKPDFTVEKSLLLTVMAAVAVMETVKEYSDADIKIKWVNDVYADGKKLCGILTEGSVSLENSGLDFAIIGIGINIYAPDGGFPEDIKNTAAAVFSSKDGRGDMKSKITAEVMNRFLDMYYGKDCDYAERYRNMSYLDGKKITVLGHGGNEQATALYINENCRLVVKTDDGEIKALSTGDVSVRIQ